MTRFTPVAFVLIALAGPAAAQEPNPALAADETAVARDILGLASPDSAERAAAAAGLRRVVAKYPSGTVYLSSADGGEAAWRAKVRQVDPGTPQQESLLILTPAPGESGGGSLSEGQHNYASYRLDHHWRVRVCYHNAGYVVGRPELRRATHVIDVRPPLDFTGAWVTWYVNGQKAREARYADGKLDGLQTEFHDTGAKASELHSAKGVAHGASRGWYPDGTPEYSHHYRDGKWDGTWTRWYADGVKLDEATYAAGRLHGRRTYWYPSGRESSISDFTHDVRDGVEAAWDRNGVLHYKRTYANGRLVRTYTDGRPDE